MLLFCAFVFVALCGLLVFLNRAGAQKQDQLGKQTTPMTSPSPNDQSSSKAPAEELKKKLTPEQFYVTQQCGTEPLPATTGVGSYRFATRSRRRDFH